MKKVLHAPLDVNWEICATGTPVFKHGQDLSLPSGRNGGPLMKVIEATNNVIVGHGDLDMVLIANGTLIQLNNLYVSRCFKRFEKSPVRFDPC